jgi:hypothetical protein
MKASNRIIVICGPALAVLAVLGASGCSSEVEKTKASLREQRGRAEEIAKQARAFALDTFEQQLARGTDQFRTAEAVKKEWDQIIRGTTKYDLVVHDGGDKAGRMDDHEEALDAMEHLAVKDVSIAGVGVKEVRIGYSDVKAVGTGGSKHERHFRATWTEGERKIGLSYYTDKETDLAAFVSLLGRLAPVVNRHVALKKGS